MHTVGSVLMPAKHSRHRRCELWQVLVIMSKHALMLKGMLQGPPLP